MISDHSPIVMSIFLEKDKRVKLGRLNVLILNDLNVVQRIKGMKGIHET